MGCLMDKSSGRQVSGTSLLLGSLAHLYHAIYPVKHPLGQIILRQRLGKETK